MVQLLDNFPQVAQLFIRDCIYDIVAVKGEKSRKTNGKKNDCDSYKKTFIHFLSRLVVLKNKKQGTIPCASIQPFFAIV